MKNLFIVIGLLAMVAATSCKKVRTCECSFDGITISVDSEEKLTKKEAKKQCEADNGGGLECKLK